MAFLVLFQALHIIAGVSWLGLDIVFNFVFIPATIKLPLDERIAFLQNIYPHVYRLISVLSLTTIISGAILSYLLTGWKDLGQVFRTPWGILILIGALLGLHGVYNHFTKERHVLTTVTNAHTLAEAQTNRLFAELKIGPWIGLVIATLIVLLMVIAARLE